MVRPDPPRHASGQPHEALFFYARQQTSMLTLHVRVPVRHEIERLMKTTPWDRSLPDSRSAASTASIQRPS